MSVVRRFALAIAASCLMGVGASACHGPDPFYRHLGDGGPTGAAGASTGAAGHAGTSGAAGSGAAGSGAAGTGAAGSGIAGAGAMDAGAMDAGAAGTGAAGTTGAAGSGAPCTKCKVKVSYTCRSEDTGQVSFIVSVTNQASIAITMSELTLRYWYTAEPGKEQELNCDFAKVGCTNVVTSADTAPTPKFQAVLPPKPKANEYVELAFKPGALTLDPFLDTGEIQLRLHNKDYSPIDQTDDYSFDCSMKGNAVDATAITAYVNGVLVWGTEPQ